MGGRGGAKGYLKTTFLKILRNLVVRFGPSCVGSFEMGMIIDILSTRAPGQILGPSYDHLKVFTRKAEK